MLSATKVGCTVAFKTTATALILEEICGLLANWVKHPPTNKLRLGWRLNLPLEGWFVLRVIDPQKQRCGFFP